MNGTSQALLSSLCDPNQIRIVWGSMKISRILKQSCGAHARVFVCRNMEYLFTMLFCYLILFCFILFYLICFILFYYISFHHFILLVDLLLHQRKFCLHPDRQINKLVFRVALQLKRAVVSRVSPSYSRHHTMLINLVFEVIFLF